MALITSSVEPPTINENESQELSFDTKRNEDHENTPSSPGSSKIGEMENAVEPSNLAIDSLSVSSDLSQHSLAISTDQSENRTATNESFEIESKDTPLELSDEIMHVQVPSVDSQPQNKFTKPEVMEFDKKSPAGPIELVNPVVNEEVHFITIGDGSSEMAEQKHFADGEVNRETLASIDLDSQVSSVQESPSNFLGEFESKPEEPVAGNIISQTSSTIKEPTSESHNYFQPPSNENAVDSDVMIQFSDIVAKCLSASDSSNAQNFFNDRSYADADRPADKKTHQMEDCTYGQVSSLNATTSFPNSSEFNHENAVSNEAQHSNDEEVHDNDLRMALGHYPYIGGGYGSDNVDTRNRSPPNENLSMLRCPQVRQNNSKFNAPDMRCEAQTSALSSEERPYHRAPRQVLKRNTEANFMPKQENGPYTEGAGSMDLQAQIRHEFDKLLHLNQLQISQLERKIDARLSVMSQKINLLENLIVPQMMKQDNNSKPKDFGRGLETNFFNGPPVQGAQNHSNPSSRYQTYMDNDQSNMCFGPTQNTEQDRKGLRFSEYQSMPGRRDEAHYQPQQFSQDRTDKMPTHNNFFERKTADRDADKHSGNKNVGKIVCVSNLDHTKIFPDTLFNLFGVYGNVQRVKFGYQDKNRAYVEMDDTSQAESVINFLDGINLYGCQIQVTTCSFERLNISRQEIENNTTKDYSKPRQQGLHRLKSESWKTTKLYPPSNSLCIRNVLKSESDEKIIEAFSLKGFHLTNVTSIDINNEEKKMVLVTLNTVEEATAALVEMHRQELTDWMPMKITFGKPAWKNARTRSDYMD